MVHRISNGRIAAPVNAPERAALRDALPQVFTFWEASGAFSPQSLDRMAETVSRFAARLAADGVQFFDQVTPQLAEAFIVAPRRGGGTPEVATTHVRRSAVRALFRALRALGLASADPTIDVRLAPRGDLAARPLTDDEIALCRISAQTVAKPASATVRAAAWALAEATGVSTEIARVRVHDLDSTSRPRAVRLSGGVRRNPRIGVLTTWGTDAIARRLAQLDAAGAGDDALIAYGGSAPAGSAKAQSSVCEAIRATLVAAGLGAERGVRPASVRHWAGRAAFDAGAPIEKVAAMMGHRSLDEAARDIGFAWHAAAGDAR